MKQLLKCVIAVSAVSACSPAAFAQECSAPPCLFDNQCEECTPTYGQQCWLDQLEKAALASRASGGRWAKLEYGYDNRDFNVMHFMGNSPLPYGFNIWGFVDFEGAPTQAAPTEDMTRFFLEIDVKKELWNNFGVIAEYNDLQGSGNAVGRFGVFYTPQLDFLSPTDGWLAGKGKLGFKIFPAETDGHGWQASFNWNKNFDEWLGGRVSAGGFFDLNLNTGPKGDVVVTEHQVRIRLIEGLHAMTEFRVNEFLQDDVGVSFGAQYRF